MVENGEISRNLDSESLRRRLTGGLESAGAGGGGRQHILGWRTSGPKP